MLINDYTEDQFIALIPSVDEATARNLYSYFKCRDPIDNFEHYLNQTALTYNDQYVRMLRDESVEYDAMVTDYIERLTKGKTTATSTKKTTGTSNGSDGTLIADGGSNQTVVDNTGKTIETPDLTAVEDVSSSSNGSRKNTGTQDTVNNITKTGSNSSHAGSVGLVKTNPMAVVNSATWSISGDQQASVLSGAGMPTKLDWSAADTQQQTSNSDAGTTSENTEDSTARTDDLTETTSDSGTGKTTTKNTGTNTTDTTGKQTTVETLGATRNSTMTRSGSTSNDESGSESSTTRNTDRYTGRHGFAPAELLEKSRDYILLMKSFAWFCGKFNHCFVWTVEL